MQAAADKTYVDWFAILDAAGTRSMTHQEIVAILHSRFGLGRWWEQKLTIMYEHARGLRQKHETQSGYQISVSRTLAYPVGKLFKMWHDKKLRGKWLTDDALAIRTAIADKALRASWKNGKSRIVVGFYPKGQTRCQLVVQHAKLGDSLEASRMRKYWSEALDNLKNVLGN
jgi:uncharacterized protein YndB with AHSA1/START domain